MNGNLSIRSIAVSQSFPKSGTSFLDSPSAKISNSRSSAGPQQVKDLIADLNNDGVTILLVEQNIRVALNTADVVDILDNGTIIHERTSDEIRNGNQALLDRYLSVTE